MCGWLPPLPWVNYFWGDCSSPIPTLLFFKVVIHTIQKQTSKKPWRCKNRRCSVHPGVLSNELVHLITMASRGLSQLPLQSHHTLCSRIPRLQSAGTLIPHISLWFLLHRLFALPAFNRALKAHFFRVAFPHSPVNTCFQATVFVLYGSNSRKNSISLVWSFD